MSLALFSSEVADWLQAGWGNPPGWPAQPEAWLPGSATFLHPMPDRVIALALQAGGGISNDGATLTVPVLIGTRGDQSDSKDGEDLAWAVWALMTDPAATQDPARRLIGDGLVITGIDAPSTPAFTITEVPAQRAEHTCTYTLTVGLAPA